MEGVVTGVNGSSFTHNGLFFALVSVDGRLRIWDTTSGKLVQEFSPSLHVETSCTCISWTRDSRKEIRNIKDLKKKRQKLRGNKATTKDDASLFPSLVIGTKNGTILPYDPIAGEAGNLLCGGHTNIVNCMKYLEETDTLYTCSEDKYVVEWSYDLQEIKSKWKADKIAVKLIGLAPSGKTLLSAGQSIKLWNLETKELLQQFHGHSSNVSLLTFSSFCAPLTNTVIEDDGYYFLSGSSEDRIINAWQINLSNPKKTAVASYMLSDSPLIMDSMVVHKDDQSLKVCVGCRDGRIHFFTCSLNGRTVRPIESSKILDLLQKEGKKSNTTPMAFINGHLYDERNWSLKLVCGTSIKPTFKNYVYSKLEETSRIVEELSKNMLLNKIVSDCDAAMEFANQDIHTKIIGSTNFVPVASKTTSTSQVILDLNDNEQDRQKTVSDIDLVSMEERLKGNQAENDSTTKLRPSRNTPNAASFSRMLIQGLHSSDDVLMNEILFNTYSENILRNTIKRIPNNLVVHLLSIVVDKLQRKPARSNSLSSWLRVIMSVHLTFLMTNENLSNVLGNLYQLLKAQQEIHPQLLNLQGKIDLLFSYAMNNKGNSSDEEELATATVLYNDDSDDETDALFGKIAESEEEVESNDAISDNGDIDENKMNLTGEEEQEVETETETESEEDEEDNEKRDNESNQY